VAPKKTGLKAKKIVSAKASRPPVKTPPPKNNQVTKAPVKKPKPTKLTAKKAVGKTSSGKRFNDISFPIVGIGASAGGLEAFEDFFAHLGSDTGMAFVVILHQHPDHNSVLPELLRRCTGMDVIQVTDQLKVKQNTVYLNPPEKQMALFNGTFHVSDSAQPRGLSLPIDFFFRSLAQDQGDKAICIILSGTGTVQRQLYLPVNDN
jgi:two-component system, chemotaxis family, CheB/CheR fusion protein